VLHRSATCGQAAAAHVALRNDFSAPALQHRALATQPRASSAGPCLQAVVAARRDRLGGVELGARELSVAAVAVAVVHDEACRAPGQPVRGAPSSAACGGSARCAARTAAQRSAAIGTDIGVPQRCALLHDRCRSHKRESHVSQLRVTHAC
jgi:hypothetical protein